MCIAGAEEMTCEDLDNRKYPPSIKLAQVRQAGCQGVRHGGCRAS